MCLLLEQQWFPKGGNCLDRGSQSILTKDGPHNVRFDHLVFWSLCSAPQGRLWVSYLSVNRLTITQHTRGYLGLELSSQPSNHYLREVTGILPSGLWVTHTHKHTTQTVPLIRLKLDRTVLYTFRIKHEALRWTEQLLCARYCGRHIHSRYLNLYNILSGRQDCYYTDEATEAQKSNIICPKSHRKWQSSESIAFLTWLQCSYVQSIMSPFIYSSDIYWALSMGSYCATGGGYGC